MTHNTGKAVSGIGYVDKAPLDIEMATYDSLHPEIRKAIGEAPLPIDCVDLIRNISGYPTKLIVEAIRDDNKETLMALYRDKGFYE